MYFLDRDVKELDSVPLLTLP